MFQLCTVMNYASKKQFPSIIFEESLINHLAFFDERRLKKDFLLHK